jgi:hypothetical protein
VPDVFDQLHAEASAPAGDVFSQIHAEVQGARPDFYRNRPGMPVPPNAVLRQELQNPSSPNFAGGLPGVTEGAPLAEGLSDWDRSSFGQTGQGIGNIARGNVARGARQVIAGAGNMTLPAAALVGPATVLSNPGTALATLGGGAVGQVGARKGAEALGATPEQAQLAGDIGGIAGGIAGGAGGRIVGNAIRQRLPAGLRETAESLFNTVSQNAGKIPVNLNNAQEGATALLDWKDKVNPGPTINKFLNRITDSEKGPLTYDEARDWYSLLSKLSADESSKLPPAVMRDLKGTVRGLKVDIGDSADQVGHAADYYRAMGNYAKAARMQETWQNLKQWAVPAAVKAAASAVGAGGVGVGG